MLKVNDVLNVEFGANLGGYKKADVDAFCDEVAKTLEVLYKENSDLVRKLQVLAEKVEEYRKDEQNIQSALLIAQRAGEQIVKDSQQQADEKISEASAEAERLLSDARTTADEVLKKTEEKVIALANDSKEKSAELLKEAAFRAESIVAEANENARVAKEEYEELKNAVADFRTSLILMYKEHLKLIGELPSEKNAETRVSDPEKTALAKDADNVISAESENVVTAVVETESAVFEDSVAKSDEEVQVAPVVEYIADDITDAFVMSSVSATVEEEPGIEISTSEAAEESEPAETAESSVPSCLKDFLTFDQAVVALAKGELEMRGFSLKDGPKGIDKLNEFVEPPKPAKKKSPFFSEEDDEETYQTEGQLSIDLSGLKFGDDYSLEDDSDDDFEEEKPRGFWRKK